MCIRDRCSPRRGASWGSLGSVFRPLPGAREAPRGGQVAQKEDEGGHQRGQGVGAEGEGG
eukprot:9502563-Alexandrium_andersonii.AAC.1